MIRADRVRVAERGAGRPRGYEIPAALEDRALALMAAANSGRDGVSVSMAARVLAGEDPELAAVLKRRSSKHSMPVAIKEVAARVRPLVAMHRDRRALGRCQAGPSGFLRQHWLEERRLRAGERVSFDDATMNIGIVVPWPCGGDRCSDRFGVRVGRFQLLLATCDGTGMRLAHVFQVREAGSYCGADAVSLFNRVNRDVCRIGMAAFEGHVWQGPRMTAAREAMGTLLLDAKGRPNLKLVENTLNPLWTRLAIELPHAQVGRFRGEEKATTDLYLRCRQGLEDPRPHFPMIEELMGAVDRSLAWLNEDRIESEVYGKWVPRERWESDMAEHPRPAVTLDEVPVWASAPELERRTVLRGRVRVTATGPMGVRVPFYFTGPELWALNGKVVRVAFDPLQVEEGATILDARRPVVLGRAECVSAGAGISLADASATMRVARSLMRREYRVMAGAVRRDAGVQAGRRAALDAAGGVVARVESEVRVVGMGARDAAAPLLAADRTDRSDVGPSIHRREAGAGEVRGAVRADLGRMAEAARRRRDGEAALNW